LKTSARFTFLFLFGCFGLFGQDGTEWLVGKVTFITSQNVYVKFSTTRAIQKGDTLFIDREGARTGCLIVENKSSASCVCKIIGDCDLERDQEVFALVPIQKQRPEKEVEAEEDERPIALDDLQDLPMPQSEASDERGGRRRFEENINGRISLASYSSFSNTYSDLHRLMGRASLNAMNIAGTGWSFEGYANYRRNYKLPQEGGQEVEDFYRIYNLAITYDIDSSFWVTLGRKINRRASSLGAIDGLQAEKHFGNYFVGAIAGFRPDIFRYDLNTDLFEYGVYGGLEHGGRNFASSTTVGMLEQQNTWQTDRRYLYVQHNSSIGRALYLFGSAELDLFARVNGNADLKPRLTNLFVSARYRFTRQVDLTVSYDSRRQIIFYETLRTEVERLLEDDEARQGIRARLNYRPFRLISLGASYGKRFQTSLQNPSDNINGYISHGRLPGIGGRVSLNYNWNRSAFLISQIGSLRYSRSIIRKYLDTDLYFRIVHYQYRASKVSLQQYYYGASLNYRISPSWSLSLLYELSDQASNQNHRLNTRIIKRFR